MARQPFPQRLHLKDWSVGPEALTLRPSHGATIGECLSYWPEVEYQMALMLALLLHADNPAAVAVYTQLRRSTAKHQALETAAKFRLSVKEQLLFDAVLCELKSTEAERNYLAHGLWGYCKDLPDAILAISQEHNAAFAIERFAAADTATTRFSADIAGNLAKNTFYYTTDALTKIFEKIKAATKMALAFNRYLLPNRPGYPELIYSQAREQLYAELTQLPPIAEYFRHHYGNASQEKLSVPHAKHPKSRKGKG